MPITYPTEYRLSAVAPPLRRAFFMASCCEESGPALLNQSELTVRVVAARENVRPLPE